MDLNTLANKLTINEMMSQPDLMETLKKSEKDIQFLQNVHFPEKQQMFGMGQKFPFYSSNYAYLLPPNMSFYDVANQSKDYQYRWFLKLSENYGLEEADKFTELLRQVSNSKPSNNVDALFNGMHLMDAPKMQQTGSHFDELDSIFMNSVQNQNMVERDLLGPLSKDLQQASTSNNFSDRNILNGIDLFNMSSKDMEEPSPQRSVPLYMRKQK